MFSRDRVLNNKKRLLHVLEKPNETLASKCRAFTQYYTNRVTYLSDARDIIKMDQYE